MEGRRSLTHDTAWSFAATGVRAVSTMVTFLLLTNILGAEVFGLYTATLPIFLLIGPVVTFGTWHVVVQRISRDRSVARRVWGSALFPGVVSAVTVALALTVMREIAAPGLSAVAVLAFGLAEFVGFAVADLGSRVLQALDHFPLSALTTIIWAAVRMLSVGATLLFSDEPTLTEIAVAFLLSSLIASVFSTLAVVRIIGGPTATWAESLDIIRNGIPYSVNSTAGTVLGDIDKQMLLRFDKLFDAGVYGAGNRLLGQAALPVYAVLGATYPRFFAVGKHQGLVGTFHYAKRLSRRVAAYAAASSVALFLLAPLADVLLGDDFAESTDVIRAMVGIPLIHLVALVVGEALTGADMQGVRNRFVIGAATLNVALNLVLIPAYGWGGAVGATYASELFLLLGMTWWIRRKVH